MILMKTSCILNLLLLLTLHLTTAVPVDELEGAAAGPAQGDEDVLLERPIERRALEGGDPMQEWEQVLLDEGEEANEETPENAGPTTQSTSEFPSLRGKVNLRMT